MGNSGRPGCCSHFYSRYIEIKPSSRGIGIVNKIRAYALQDAGADTVDANEYLGFAPDLRDYRQCVEILQDLGVRRVRLLSNNPMKVATLLEAGLTVLE